MVLCILAHVAANDVHCQFYSSYFYIFIGFIDLSLLQSSQKDIFSCNSGAHTTHSPYHIPYFIARIPMPFLYLAYYFIIIIGRHAWFQFFSLRLFHLLNCVQKADGVRKTSQWIIFYEINCVQYRSMVGGPHLDVTVTVNVSSAPTFVRCNSLCETHRPLFYWFIRWDWKIALCHHERNKKVNFANCFEPITLSDHSVLLPIGHSLLLLARWATRERFLSLVLVSILALGVFCD